MVLFAEGAAGHAQQGREAERTANEVVHPHAVDIHALVLVVHAAIAEVHGAEVIRGRVVIYVVVGAGKCGHALRGPFVVVEGAFVENQVFEVAVIIVVAIYGLQAYLAKVNGVALTGDPGAEAVVAGAHDYDIFV